MPTTTIRTLRRVRRKILKDERSRTTRYLTRRRTFNRMLRALRAGGLCPGIQISPEQVEKFKLCTQLTFTACQQTWTFHFDDGLDQEPRGICGNPVTYRGEPVFQINELDEGKIYTLSHHSATSDGGCTAVQKSTELQTLMKHIQTRADSVTSLDDVELTTVNINDISVECQGHITERKVGTLTYNDGVRDDITQVIVIHKDHIDQENGPPMGRCTLYVTVEEDKVEETDGEEEEEQQTPLLHMKVTQSREKPEPELVLVPEEELRLFWNGDKYHGTINPNQQKLFTFIPYETSKRSA